MDLPVISRRTRFTASREHVRGYDAFRLNGSHVFSSKERERERNLLIVGSWNGDFKKTFSYERNPLRSVAGQLGARLDSNVTHCV